MSVIDVGGGESMLVDRLVERGMVDLTVLDIADREDGHYGSMHVARGRLLGRPLSVGDCRASSRAA